MRKLFSAILVTLLLAAALPLQVFAANTSGGVIPTITLGETVSETREKNDEVNLFFFEVPVSGPVELRFLGDLGSVRIIIYDADEKTAWSKSALFNNVTEQLSIVETIHLTAGTYQIRIGQGSGYGKGNYSLTLSHTAITESFPESQTNNQNTLATAKAIAFNQAYTGYIASNDDKNFYQFTLAQAEKVTVYLDAAGRSLRLYIYDENGKSVLDTVTAAVTGSKSKDLPAGTYYLCITDTLSSYGTYDFSISAPSVPVPSSAAFTDTEGHWANEYIGKAFENGLVNGVGNGMYNPDANVSNAEWSQMTANLLWAEEYRVTTPGAPWWYNAARWNFEMGFLDGTVLADSYTKTTDLFPADAVNTAINRYDMAQVIYNIAMSDTEAITVGTVNTSGMSGKIADYEIIPVKYRTAVEYCYAAGFITGTDSKGTFDGNASMTRAAAATVLCRLLDAKNGVWVVS